MPCGTAQVKYAVRPCSFGWRWGWSQTWIFLYLVPVCICKQCFTTVRGGISGTRKRHDTTPHYRNSEPAKKRNEKEEKKRNGALEGRSQSTCDWDFWNGSSTSIDREFNILSTFYSFPCLQQTWALVWIDRDGYPNGKQRMLHAVESLMAP